MKRLVKFSSVLLLLTSFSLSAQVNNTKEKGEADKLYEKYAYIDAIKIYEKIANKGYEDQGILQNLGNSYYFNADYKNAASWYGKLFKYQEKKNVIVSGEYYYRYAQTLKSIKKYKESDNMMEKFVQMASSTDRRVNMYNTYKNYKEEIKANSNRTDKPRPVKVNTEFSEYAPSFYGDNEIVYTGSKRAGAFKKFSGWTGDGYYDLYKVKRTKDGTEEKAELFSSVLNTSLNESSSVFTKDLKTIYFTRNNFTDGKKGKDDKGAILLKLYKSEFKNGEWTEAVELPFNNDSYSVAHPALSPKEDYLYFASDMPGTKGLSDIFRVKINGDGTYGNPENLGEKINTEARETFPYIDSDGILYFSSDGIPGLGGLDIFSCKFDERGNVASVMNVGEPLNSSQDDFSYIFDTNKRQGFFASNRSPKSKDDIYIFTEKTPLKHIRECKKIVKGIVKDIDTKEVITDVTVTLSDKRQQEITKQANESNGEFDFKENVFGCADDYVYVRAQKADYSVEEQKVELKEEEGDSYAEIYLKKVKKEVKKGDDLGKVLNLQMIYFDFDKADIRPDAEIELAKILEVLLEYPTMVIDISSHTDSRGSDEYNLKLSDRRAKSTMNWLISKGISKDRLSAKGYGETQLLNKCSNGVDCTIEEHQLNRRSEFIIINM